MKKARLQKTKQVQEKTNVVNESYSIKDLIKITLIIGIIFGIIYFITNLLVKPQEEVKQTTTSVIDNEKILLSNLLNRKDSEYYVLATKESLYKANANYLDIYNKYINDYKNEEDSLTVYRVDLDDALNNKYLSDELNISNDISDLKLNDEALFKIKDGKIEKYYMGKTEIINGLKEL